LDRKSTRKGSFMGSIRITSTPPGIAPEWVREQWVGVEIPLPKHDEDGIQVGVPDNLFGYQVETKVAIEALRKKSPEAVEWWEENIPLGFVSRLVFSRDVCQLIK